MKWTGILAVAAVLPTGAKEKPVRLMTLDPGHFHAALVQKSMYPEVDAVVNVYAPAGPDLDGHLARIEGLESGANDYIEKPYEQQELLLRLGNLIDWNRGNYPKPILSLV